MEIVEKIVEFEIYCPKCKYLEVDDINGQDPCNECLDSPTNINSKKPIRFKEDPDYEKKMEELEKKRLAKLDKTN